MSAELELRWELLELQLEIAGWKWAEVSRWGSGYWKVSVSGYQEAVSVWRYKSGMAYVSGKVCK